ncbi:hypothetical protein OUZ56_006352 [Daphnia magna]|uniref:Uncharacterized protein n=1 Tax=Daphnia magna TaxID=35525 RepID=A0ABQ9YVY7_9CRUS|nr:hypothetical protein OUZ56_006352 [Daphnia magna]
MNDEKNCKTKNIKIGFRCVRVVAPPNDGKCDPCGNIPTISVSDFPQHSNTVVHTLDQFYRIAYWIGDLAHTQTKQSSGSIRSK